MIHFDYAVAWYHLSRKLLDEFSSHLAAYPRYSRLFDTVNFEAAGCKTYAFSISLIILTQKCAHK